MAETLKRRDIFRMSGAAVTGIATNLIPTPAASQGSGGKKRVLVLGAGISGLSCAYEVMRRGHNVTVLEASGRAGGHVRTSHDPFADGLYADLGAEHFYYTGYTEDWRYGKEVSLTPIAYPRREHMVHFLKGERFTDEDLQRRSVLAELGFNQRETDFLSQHDWAELQLLYLQRYVDMVRDEANPFEPGLRQLDQ